MVMLEILYRDDFCVVVNKPAGMLVHRTELAKYETVFLMQTLRDQIGRAVYPVHRLDRPTSGVILFAFSSSAARALSEQFEQREVCKTYWAIVRGWTDSVGCINHPLKEELDALADRLANADKAAQEAITDYRLIAQAELPFSTQAKFATSRYSCLEVVPQTGRKHQIRRHLKHIFHPILGDTTHGDLRQNQAVRQFCGVSRLMLHARSLQFFCLGKGEVQTVIAPVDQDWRRLVCAFAWDEILFSNEDKRCV